jgi:hypothetical protein
LGDDRLISPIRGMPALFNTEGDGELPGRADFRQATMPRVDE